MRTLISICYGKREDSLQPLTDFGRKRTHAQAQNVRWLVVGGIHVYICLNREVGEHQFIQNNIDR